MQRVRVTRRGTRIRWRAAACAGLVNVKVKATLATSCDAIAGKVRAKRTKPILFAAASSRCADGVVDAGAGEQCDGAACAGDVAVRRLRLRRADRHVDHHDDAAAERELRHDRSPDPRLHPCGGRHRTVAYADDPPSSGSHYPIWARWGAYTETIPRGYWVHDLEHGGIVLLHRPGRRRRPMIDALDAAFDAIPLDPSCTHRRAVLTPDPLLQSAPIAVVSWGWQMLCDGVDQQAIVDFATAHRGNGREDLCAQGGYP